MLRVPSKEELVRPPKGSSFYYLPDRYPIGYDPKKGSFQEIDKLGGKQVYAAGCFLVPTYTRLMLPAYWLKKKNPCTLPLWAYNTLGYYNGSFYTTAMRTDTKTRQLPRSYSCDKLKQSMQSVSRYFPHNRLVQHLAYCAEHYQCQNAQNFFFGRWEAPLPASRFCNSNCLGCLSLQEEEGIASHRRIGFTPTSDELAEVALFHINRAKEAIVSFGQGCEGEPLLAHKVIKETIKKIRLKTSKGTININTNASKPGYVEKLIKVGLDSMRVSLNSVRASLYTKYFQPRGYRFEDVLESIRIAKKNKIFVSINLLTFPGWTDDQDEVSALSQFIKKSEIDMLQLKNLNIDPDRVINRGLVKHSRPIGMKRAIQQIQSTFPRLKLSYCNLPKEELSHTDGH